jgi:NADH dehydrogenase (ubiquinone) Fe-S protein 6
VAARPVPALSRGLAGPVKIYEADQEDASWMGPSEVARTEPKIEMGVRYEAGVPSPMEGAYYHEPVVVDGLVAKTGGDGLGCPVQYIKLSAWCAAEPINCLFSRRYPRPPTALITGGSLFFPQGPHACGVQVFRPALCFEEGAGLRGQAGRVIIGQ